MASRYPVQITGVDWDAPENRVLHKRFHPPPEPKILREWDYTAPDGTVTRIVETEPRIWYPAEIGYYEENAKDPKGAICT